MTKVRSVFYLFLSKRKYNYTKTKADHSIGFFISETLTF